MGDKNDKIALVTGANSGIGLETVKKLSRLGYREIILACRTDKKGKITIDKLLDEGFDSIYSILVIDVSEKKSSHNALNELISRNQKIDLLILNACTSPGALEKNHVGMELTFASALLGHHILTTGLLEAKLLSKNARIITAGSEAARGDVPMMPLPNLNKLIQQNNNKRYNETFKSFMFPKSEKKHSPLKTYALAKLFVSLWTSSLARRLPEKMIANSISPGATPNTNFARHQSWAMRKIMMPMMNKIGPMFGMSGTLSDAAHRYLKILDFDETTNGRFWVSKKGKMAGPLVLFSSSNIDNIDFQNTVWDIVDEMSNN